MKKIFNILMIAAVALGAVACDNAIDDNLTPEQNGESLSIEVEISDATKVALGDFVEDKGYKLDFEDGDQLLVTTVWGGDTTNAENNFWFTYSSETGLFTCTTTGVSAIKGQTRHVFHLATHPEIGLIGGGVLCDSEAGLNGVKMVGYTSALGEEKITLDVYPILKYTSESPVTFTANKGIFGAIKSWGIGQYAEYTFPAGTNVYVPIYESGEITLSATIKGEVVKEATKLTFATNKIYNLGTLEANPVTITPDEAEITINGEYDDWDAVVNCVATLPEDETTDVKLKTLKAFADQNNIYFYVEFDHIDVSHLELYFDLDNNATTGSSKSMWSQNAYEWFTQGRLCKWEGDTCTARTYSSTFYSKVSGVDNTSIAINSTASDINSSPARAELSFPRETLNQYIGEDGYISVAALTLYDNNAWGQNGYLPRDGKFLKIAVPAAE